MQLPSPISTISFRGYQIDVKRDDLIDPFVSGNKWRKLKYTVQEAKAQGKNHLVTFGGAYSNHLLATAAAGAQLGFKTTAFVRGDAVKNPVLSLCKIYGMQLIFTDRTAYRDKDKLFADTFGSNENAFFVQEGGASASGVKGCTEIINELEQNYTHLFCAAGTGTTAAGLLTEINKQKLNTTLHVVPVLKGAHFIADEIAQYQPDLSKLNLHLDYHFGGYGKTPPEIFDFIKAFSAATGILIDPIYTAKMFYAIFDLLAKQTLAKNSKILALHTGGIHGILGKIEHF